MKSESTSKENLQPKKDIKVENLLSGISESINIILNKLSKALEGDKVYSLNTLGHIIVPGVLGSICAVLIAVYGLDVPGRNQEPSDNNNLSMSESTAYVVVATTIASVVTGFLVGIPNSSEKRIRTWLSCVALSLSLPTGYTLLIQSQQGIQAKIEENKQLAESLASYQIIANNSRNPQVDLSLKTTQLLEENNQVSENIKQESFLSTISLINSNPDILKNSEIASRYFTIYKDGLEYDEELTNKGLKLPGTLNTIVRQNPNYLALDRPKQNLFKSSITNFSSNDVQKILRERN